MNRSGDGLLTIEAMKMETALHAARGGAIDRLPVTPGVRIGAKFKPPRRQDTKFIPR
jgi:pyruvate carboxylase